MTTVTKGLIQRGDVAWYDGVNTTASRTSSTGGTTTGLRIGNTVDALQVYGGGTARTAATLNRAIEAIGTTRCIVELAPGEWTIDADVTFPDNVEVMFGGYMTVAGGKTVTLGGNLDIRPEWFGALADGTTDCTTAINAAVTCAKAKGGGEVHFREGTYLTGQITLPSQVTLRGRGHGATILKAKDSLNDNLIESENFSTLSGSNAWYVGTEDVNWGFGLVGMQIDGNKANQTSGTGVAIYGKNYIISDVVIRDAYGYGLYSECGSTVGQTDYRDLPEASIGPLWVRNCGSDGVHFRGPHDARFNWLISALNGGSGFKNQSSAGVYSGFCKIGFMHCYANTSQILFNETIWADGQIIGDGDNISFGVDAANSIVNQITTIGSTNTQTAQAIDIGVTGVRISQVNISCDTSSAVNGLKINAARAQIGEAYIFGSSGTGTGLLVTDSGDSLAISMIQIRGFDGAGGVGIDIGNGGAADYVHIYGGEVVDCKTCFDYSTAGVDNFLQFNILTNAGQTQVAGNSPSASDRFSVNASGTATKYSRNSIVTSGSVVLTSTSEQTFTLPHSLLWTPDIKKCSIAMYEVTDVSDYVVNLFRISSVDATNVYVDVKLGTASGTGGATAKIIATAEV